MVRGRGINVNPLLHFDCARAIIDSVCDIGGLRADISYLTNERYLRTNVSTEMRRNGLPAAYLADRLAIDFEVSIWVRLLRIQYLLDCKRPDCVSAIAALYTRYQFNEE